MKKALKILLILLSAFAVFLLALLIFYFSVTAGTKLDPNKLTLTQNNVTVYDSCGKAVDYSESQESVAYSALPQHLSAAFVAVEDKRFFSHSGLDFRRIGKAALKNLTSFSFREGASTISQQLIKNTHLTNEKTVTRKLKEMNLTRALEKKYSKEQILELYLNSIYFGHSAFGIDSAARYYFGKKPQELTPAESATLAALVKSPNKYSPFKDGAKCLSRRNFVLDLMKAQNMITAEECAREKAVPLPEEPAPKQKKSAYLEYVFEELSGILPEFRSGDCLKIYTYLDSELQKELEQVNAESDIITLVRDNKTNAIKALYSTCGIIKRLPASTIKPLAVYGPALEENLIAPATPLLDEEVNFGGYSPKNCDGTYGGYMSARYALSHSINIPAVKLLNMLGVEKAASYLEKMGLSIEDEDKTLALALGGMKQGYTLPALADGYAVFANGGVYESSGTISKIEDSQGKVLYQRDSLFCCQVDSLDKLKIRQAISLDRRVFSEETCALVNDILKTAAKEGTAKRLKGLPYTVCAKTGTTGTDAGNTDAYILAYTAEDTVAVWLGNRDNSVINATGGGAAANEALRIFRTLYSERSPADFLPCEAVTQVALDREEYEENHRLLLMDPTAPEYLAMHELFKKSAIPEGMSTKFQCPKIQKPLISVKNGAVEIILCQTYYYDYEVKRECDGEISIIYSGSYRKNIVDNSVQGGKRYTYTITPYYQGIAGESVTLPSIYIEKTSEIPDDWWTE